MKTVFTNDEIIDAYIAQKQDSGRTVNGAMYFNGVTLYSYGSHFPLCILDESKKVAICNSAKNSVTTAKQQGMIRRAAIGKGYHVIYVDGLKFAGTSIAPSNFKDTERKMWITNRVNNNLSSFFNLYLNEKDMKRKGTKAHIQLMDRMNDLKLNTFLLISKYGYDALTIVNEMQKNYNYFSNESIKAIDLVKADLKQASFGQNYGTFVNETV